MCPWIWLGHAGWCLYLHSEKWKDGRVILRHDYFCDIGEPLQLLIFPEGTDLIENSMAWNNKFVEKNGLQKYEYVLYPKATVLLFVVDHLRTWMLPWHQGDIPSQHSSERHLLLRDSLKEIHFPSTDTQWISLPTSKEDLQLWCQKWWEEKKREAVLLLLRRKRHLALWDRLPFRLASLSPGSLRSNCSAPTVLDPAQYCSNTCSSICTVCSSDIL